MKVILITRDGKFQELEVKDKFDVPNHFNSWSHFMNSVAAIAYQTNSETWLVEELTGDYSEYDGLYGGIKEINFDKDDEFGFDVAIYNYDTWGNGKTKEDAIKDMLVAILDQQMIKV